MKTHFCFSLDQYDTTFIVLNELVNNVNVTKSRNVIGCGLESFKTANSYANNETTIQTFGCGENETLIYAFDRFETYEPNDFLTMIDTESGQIVFSKAFEFVEHLRSLFRYLRYSQ